MATKESAVNESGFTLVELLVACILIVVVMLGVASLMVTLIKAPRLVTSRIYAADSGQVVAHSIGQGIRNSSNFRLTTPSGPDQLLVARTAQNGSPLTWVCAAWYFSASDGSVRYHQSLTAIPAVPTSTDLASWSVLGSSVAPSSGTGIFTVSGQELVTSFTVAAAGQSGQPTGQLITTSVFSRGGSGGSPACY